MPLFRCPACRGSDRGCEVCGGGGRFVVRGCPREQVGPAEIEAMQAAQLAEAGFLPETGGWLDQTQSGMDMIRAVQIYTVAIREEVQRTQA